MNCTWIFEKRQNYQKRQQVKQQFCLPLYVEASTFISQSFLVSSQIFTVSDDRLSEIFVRVGNYFDPGNQSSFDPATYSLCSFQNESLCAGELKIFRCGNPIVGRFVTIHFPWNKLGVMTLCEVEVYETYGQSQPLCCQSVLEIVWLVESFGFWKPIEAHCFSCIWWQNLPSICSGTWFDVCLDIRTTTLSWRNSWRKCQSTKCNHTVQREMFSDSRMFWFFSNWHRKMSFVWNVQGSLRQ